MAKNEMMLPAVLDPWAGHAPGNFHRIFIGYPNFSFTHG